MPDPWWATTRGLGQVDEYLRGEYEQRLAVRGLLGLIEGEE